MNYYIQGSPAKAKEIKAAFKRLGLRADGYDFSRIDVLFFTFEAKGKTYMMSSSLGTGLDNIRNCASGKLIHSKKGDYITRTAGGFKWEFENN